MLFPSVIKENFLNDQEIEFLKDSIYSKIDTWKDIKEGRTLSFYYPWKFYSSEFSELNRIFSEKFKNTFDIKLEITHSHIFHSFEPYHVHTDFYQDKAIPKYLRPSYTLIIPLEDHNSHTIAFEQFSEIKEFIEDEHPIIDSIDDVTYEKYFTHLDRDTVRRLSIKEIFSWKKGSLHACDRRYYHCSDNYVRNGLKEKKAIIMWACVNDRS